MDRNRKTPRRTPSRRDAPERTGGEAGVRADAARREALRRVQREVESLARRVEAPDAGARAEAHDAGARAEAHDIEARAGAHDTEARAEAHDAALRALGGLPDVGDGAPDPDEAG